MNIFGILYLIVLFYLVVLFIRAVFDWIHTFTKTWEPTGVIRFIHDLAYGLTNPPLKLVRKAVPVIKIGRELKLDVAFLAVMLICSVTLIVLAQWR